MDPLIVTLLGLIAAETSYLTYKSRPRTKIAEQSMLIDTSVLIDGRILPIARSYLITAPLIIPRSVVRELQYMADKADHDKRERAREGLDMIEQLQRLDGITVNVVTDDGSEAGVDERLVELAQKYGARLCTVDYNLNKSARAQGVDVVNINELAHALRIIHLPGETISLTLVQPGQESRQAVGYLDDGTMVVVDDAKALIHHEVTAEVTRVLQTSAGKMMFARLNGPARQEAHNVADTNSRAETVKNRPAPRASRVRAQSTGRSRGGSGKVSNNESPEGADEGTRKHLVGTHETSAPAASRADRLKPTDSDSRDVNGTKPVRQPRHRRRRTPEDALVDLANNE